MTTAQMREARGEARGEVRGRATMLLKLLTHKFGSVSPPVQEKVYAADTQQLDVWAEQTLNAATIEEALA